MTDEQKEIAALREKLSGREDVLLATLLALDKALERVKELEDQQRKWKTVHVAEVKDLWFNGYRYERVEKE